MQTIKCPTVFQSRQVEKHECQTTEQLLSRLVVYNVYGEFNGNAVNWDSSAPLTLCIPRGVVFICHKNEYIIQECLSSLLFTTKPYKTIYIWEVH